MSGRRHCSKDVSESVRTLKFILDNKSEETVISGPRCNRSAYRIRLIKDILEARHHVKLREDRVSVAD